MCQTFIPPTILESLARNGVESAVSSIQQSTISRRGRTPRIEMPQTAIPRHEHKTSEIIVYDCEGTWKQRVTEVLSTTGMREASPISPSISTGGPAAIGGPSQAQISAKNAMEHVRFARDFLEQYMDRKGIDGQGGTIHVNVNFGDRYNNAFWDGDELTMGTGDNRVFTDFSKSLDVISHEMAHGLVQFISPLEYVGESGALNEHFADVFGSAVQAYKRMQEGLEHDWVIGNEIMGPDLYGETLRSMESPGTAYNHRLLGHDPQPAHYADRYTGTEDRGGVHINSGIMNKAFTLVAKRVGFRAAGLIWFAGLQRLWPTACFDDAKVMIVESAREKEKANRLVRDEQLTNLTQVVRSAFAEVGV